MNEFVPEIEEAEARTFEFSHLVETHCTDCRSAVALSTPSKLKEAKCGSCWSIAAGGTGVVMELHGKYTVPRGFDLIRQGPIGAIPPAPLPPHPAPQYVGEWMEVAAFSDPLEAEPRCAPGAALSLAEWGQGHGWRVQMRYAVGTAIHASQGRPLGLVRSFAVKFDGRPDVGRNAVAVYESPVDKNSWSWRSVWVIGADIGFCGALGITELKDFLRAPEKRGVEWFAELRTLAAQKQAAQKQAAKDRPKVSKKKEGMR